MAMTIIRILSCFRGGEVGGEQQEIVFGRQGLAICQLSLQGGDGLGQGCLTNGPLYLQGCLRGTLLAGMGSGLHALENGMIMFAKQEMGQTFNFTMTNGEGLVTLPYA
jgi:hypothetical protein